MAVAVLAANVASANTATLSLRSPAFLPGARGFVHWRLRRFRGRAAFGLAHAAA